MIRDVIVGLGCLLVCLPTQAWAQSEEPKAAGEQPAATEDSPETTQPVSAAPAQSRDPEDLPDEYAPDPDDVVDEPVADAEEPSYEVADEYYDELAPHGEWYEAEPYGPVWRPAIGIVGSTFRPYASGGRWVYTDVGWWFSSDWDWGEVVFHYGYWVLVPRLGWVWVPGREWAPARVVWRTGGGFIGWAPLPPPWMSLALDPDCGCWFFVPTIGFVGTNINVYLVPQARVADAYRSTRPERGAVRHHGRHFLHGPRPSMVRAETRQPVVRHVAPQPAARHRTADRIAPVQRGTHERFGMPAQRPAAQPSIIRLRPAPAPARPPQPAPPVEQSPAKPKKIQHIDLPRAPSTSTQGSTVPRLPARRRAH